MLTNKEKALLKAKAHHLNPVVMIGQHGLTDAVLAEIDVALTAHELIKIKASGIENEDKKSIADRIANETQSECIQIIGNILIVYRKKQEET